jgi:hypothetical protein
MLSRIVRASCAVAGRRWWPVAAAVAVTVAVRRAGERVALLAYPCADCKRARTSSMAGLRSV